MRVLHIVHQYPPEQVGGTELYTLTLAHQQLEAGHSVAIFAPATSLAASAKKREVAGVKEYRPHVGQRSGWRLFLSSFGDGSLIHAFAEALKEFQPDVVHVEHAMGLPASIVDQLVSVGVPFVVTLHDYWYICANAQLLTNYDRTICSGPDRFRNCARCALNRVGLPSTQLLTPLIAPVMARRNQKIRPFLDKAEWLVAPTNFVKQVHEGFGIPSDKIRVIPHGIDVPDIEFIPAVPTVDSLRISYIGGLSWQKGVHILIQAVNKMPESGVSLTIYGDKRPFPKYVNYLEEQVRHSGTSLPGSIDRDQLWSALNKSDIVVVPSLWYETASLIIQESFAAGVPVVASRIGALQERVSDGVDGLLTDPGASDQLFEALMSLYHQPELILKLQGGIKAVRTIVEHSTDINLLYKSILKNSSHSN
jgi:glycosyltransferase involved in cell wall biosynthesis